MPFITSINQLYVIVCFIKIYLEMKPEQPPFTDEQPNIFNSRVGLLTQKGADEDENLNDGSEIFVGSFLRLQDLLQSCHLFILRITPQTHWRRRV